MLYQQKKKPFDKEIRSESKKTATGILARKKVSCNIYAGPLCLPAVILINAND